jgi:segregation and condensation protein A
MNLRFEQLEAFTDLQISWVGSESGEIAISDEFDTTVTLEEASDE